MSQPQALYRLQKLDLELDTRRARVREINAALEDRSVVLQGRAAVEQLQATLRPQETRASNLNLELKTIASQNSDLNGRLYGGKVSNPKELGDIEHKIAELKRRNAELENQLLETMISVEELQASLVDATQKQNELEKSRSAEEETLTAELSRLKREIKALKAERETAEAQVNDENKALYQTLRASKQGHAVVLLKGDMCSYCRVDQTSNIVQQVRQGRDLIHCQSCGRILVIL
ncbi:MAG TPA: hypothetical protein VHP83_08500 [Aggregatilineaceae bacterium]|nr:hypothetical protein [Aggregatilineaceae bacterium]